MLRQNLEAYFASTAFAFSKPEHVVFLRQYMEHVYLRQKPLVSVDVEAYERNQRLVTEIGVSIFDPADQQLLPVPRIDTVHIIISEHKSKINTRYVPNNKLRFNGGTLYEMTLSELKYYLKPIFTRFFAERNAVLVGHNISGDVRWLANHGLSNLDNVPQIDTQKLFQISRRRGATLSGILRHAGILNANLHNAANDAYYTLLAAMFYCDPAQRQRLSLDTYDEMEGVQGPGKHAKSRQKMSDIVEVLPGGQAPSMGIEEES